MNYGFYIKEGYCEVADGTGTRFRVDGFFDSFIECLFAVVEKYPEDTVSLQEYFKAELEIEKAFQGKRINQKKFWGIIDEVNREMNGKDQEAILEATMDKLSYYTSDEIKEWCRIQKDYIEQANRTDLWDACYASGVWLSDDGFHDFRAWLVSQGQDVYFSILHHPESIASYIAKGQEIEFEGYHYIDYYLAKILKEIDNV